MTETKTTQPAPHGLHQQARKKPHRHATSLAEVADGVRRVVTKAGIGAFSVASGVPQSTLRQTMDRQVANPRLSTLLAILDAAGYELRVSKKG